MTAPVASLLPCPFCGGTIHTYQQTSKVPDNWAVRCGVCGGQCGPSASSVAARYNWNLRVLTPAGEGGLPELLDEDAAVIRGLESIANDPERGLWSQSLSRGALRIIRRLSTPEQPGSAVQSEEGVDTINAATLSDAADDPALGLPEARAMLRDASGLIRRLAATAGVQGEDWQQRCLDLGFKYWRAPDAHGVECTHEQALALLRDLLGVEVDFTTPPPAPAAEQGARSSEDVCDDCNGPNSPPWFAPSDLWNRVVGNEGGMLCPRCFIRRAQSAGVDGVWRVAPDATQPEARGVVTEDMVRQALHFCPSDLSAPGKWRWIAARLNDAIAAAPEQPCTCPQHPDDVIPCPRHRGEQPEVQGAVLEELRMMSALTGEAAMAYYYQHPDGRQRGPYMLPNTGGGNLEACGYEQVLLYTRPAAPGAVGVDEATLTRWRSLIDHAPSEVQAEITAALAGKAGTAVSDTRDNDDLDDAAFAATVRDAIAGKDGA